MALIDTGHGVNWIDRIPDLVMRLRDTLIEELAAINTYDCLIKSVGTMGFQGRDPNGDELPVPKDMLSIDDAKEVAEFLAKIRDDELGHAGALSELMKRLDSNVDTQMSKGI